MTCPCVNTVITAITNQSQPVSILPCINNAVQTVKGPNIFRTGETALQRYRLIPGIHIHQITIHIERLTSAALDGDRAIPIAALQNGIAIAGCIIIIKSQCTQFKRIAPTYKIIDRIRTVGTGCILNTSHTISIQIDSIIAGWRVDGIMPRPRIDTIIGLRTI